MRNVTAVLPARTFWDKVIILHGLSHWHERRGQLRHGGQRVSRHYYDIYRLLQHADAGVWQADRRLAEDCAHHARLFFGSADLGLETAVHGSLTLSPSTVMHDVLVRDYQAMGGMVFGHLPPIDDVMKAIQDMEKRLNTKDDLDKPTRAAPQEN